MRRILLATALLALSAAKQPPADLVIVGGTVYDGSGQPGFNGWVAVTRDRISAVGTGKPPAAARTLDARGQAVAPGFVNMLSWATASLIQDGRALSDLKQGVTLEVMGEGDSLGPLTPAMKADIVAKQADIRYPVTWTTLGEYLAGLERRGIAVNVASFVGAATVRIHELGEGDVQPTPAQLGATCTKLVSDAMNEGALGRRLGADLCARRLRQNARADRARDRRRALWRHVH